jgi:hypothetical protein
MAIGYAISATRNYLKLGRLTAGRAEQDELLAESRVL